MSNYEEMYLELYDMQTKAIRELERLVRLLRAAQQVTETMCTETTPDPLSR